MLKVLAADCISTESGGRRIRCTTIFAGGNRILRESVSLLRVNLFA